jgi:hypothetical protein
MCDPKYLYRLHKGREELKKMRDPKIKKEGYRRSVRGEIFFWDDAQEKRIICQKWMSRT